MVILVWLWRAWFYMAIGLSIIILFPFIFITSLTPKWYRQFFFFSRVWAWMVLVLTGFWPKVKWEEKPSKDEVYIICANHTSMIDIMMTLAMFPNCFLFIGKRELAKLPLFGYFYKRTNLLVDRTSLRSRKQVFERGAERIDQGQGLCIYPEGGVPAESVVLGKFKSGAFRLAVEKGISIIPVTFLNNKRHLPYNFNKGYPGILKAIVHPFLKPLENKDSEIDRLKDECYNLIFETLNNHYAKKLLTV